MDNLSEEKKRIKHLFMTYRNGIVADSLRKAGMPYGIIFGLQLPQLRQIAAELRASLDETTLINLASELHEERNVRESRILAMAIFPPTAFSEEIAVNWLTDLKSREEADLLPFLLLRHTPHIPRLLQEVAADTDLSDIQRYAIQTLERFQ